MTSHDAPSGGSEHSGDTLNHPEEGERFSSTSKSFEGRGLLEVTESYVRYYAAGSSHTARAKRLDLDRFVLFLQQLQGYSKPEKLKVSDWNFSSTQRFVDESLSKGEAPSTVARRLATLKHMGRILSEKIAGFINPAREVKAPKVHAAKPKGLSKKEVKRAQSRARNRLKEKGSFQRIRNEMLFMLLVGTGLRADEVRLLRLGQLTEDLDWLKNVRTKGRRYRNVYITSELRPHLEEYLNARADKLKGYYAKLNKKADRALPLFISGYRATPGDPDSFLMGAKSIWRAVNELSTETHLHPHLLRHSFALDLLDSSNDVRLVAQALGHSDVRITMRYTERVEEEIAKALEKSRNHKET